MPSLLSGWKLSACLATLAGVIAVQLADDKPPRAVPNQQSAQRPPQRQTQDMAAQAATTDGPKDGYSEIAARPLFHPTRRPMPPVAVAQPAAALTPPVIAQPAAAPNPLRVYSLVGVAASGKTRVALIKKANDTVSITEGASLEGWIAAEISSSGVRFRSGDSEFLLELPKPIPGVVVQAPPRIPAINRLHELCGSDNPSCPSL